MPRLEWSYNGMGRWEAFSRKLTMYSYFITVNAEGMFEVKNSKLVEQTPRPFTTLGLAKSWCQDCEDHLENS